MSQGSLDMVVGPHQVETINFSETIIIGRDPSQCHLMLDDHKISAVHCRIEEQRGAFQLVDLGSANGSHVNGEKVGRTELKSGDTVKLGSFVLMFSTMPGTAKKLPDPRPKTADADRPVHRTVAPGKKRVGGTQQIIRKHDKPQPKFAEGKRFGRFEVVGEIGRGGMGVIYRVKDIKSKTGREYALKALPGGAFAGREVVERFMDEARALARIKQDGVVRIYKIDEEAGTPYYVMDFIDGETLDKRLSRGKEYSPEEALAACRDIAKIIAGVHHTGLIHRDLTPNNVIYDKDGKTWLVDFGLARDLMVRERLTRTGELIGTPHYVSPEQAEGDLAAVDRRTDIYALGAIMYRMMLGRVPFDGESVPQIVMKVLLEDVTPPRQLDKSIPLDIEAICLKCLAKDKEHRYLSADEMVADMERCLRGEPVRAEKLTAAKQFSQAAWKVRLALGLLAMLVLFILGLTASYSLRIHKIRSYRQGKLDLFLKGGERMLEVAQAPGTPLAEEINWWNAWEGEMSALAKAADERGRGWRFSQTYPPVKDSIGRLERLRDAIAMFQAAADLDEGNEQAAKGVERAEALIVKGGLAEVTQAKKMLERERVQGAIFHATRALEHLPRLPASAADQARQLITGAQRSMLVSVPGADEKDLRVAVKLLPADAEDLEAGTPETSPFQTRKAGRLAVGVGPPRDRFWFTVNVDKSLRTLRVQYRPLEQALVGCFRLPEVARSAASLTVRQSHYITPEPLSQEQITLIGERQDVPVDAGADPRQPGLAPPEHGQALMKSLGRARLPTVAEVKAWLRFSAPETMPLILATDGGTAVVLERVGRKATLSSAAKGGAIYPVITADGLPAYEAAQRALVAFRDNFRRARAKHVADYETALTHAVKLLGEGKADGAGDVLSKLLASWKTASQYRAIERMREADRKKVGILLSGLRGSDPRLSEWLMALGKGDQEKLGLLTPQLGGKRKLLEQLFVQHAGRWYPSKQSAMRDGALYFDEASAEWMRPNQAAEIGWVWIGDRKAWIKASDAAAEGYGTLIQRDGKPVWLPLNVALEAGYAYHRASQSWATIEQLWARGAKIERLKGSWLDCALLTPSDHLILLSKEEQDIGFKYFLERRATLTGDPVWKVEIKAKGRTVPTSVLARGNTVAVIYEEIIRFFDSASGDYRFRVRARSRGTATLLATGLQLAVAGRVKGTIDYFDTQREANGPTYSYTTGPRKLIHTLCYHPEGLDVLIGYQDGELVLLGENRVTQRAQWDTKGGQVRVSRILSAPVGKYRVVSSGQLKPTEVFFSVDGTETRRVKHRSAIIEFAVTQGGTHIVSSANNNTMLFWDLRGEVRALDGKLSDPDAEGILGQSRVFVSSRNDWLLTIGTDGVVRQWHPQR